jgi:cytochrome c
MRQIRPTILLPALLLGFAAAGASAAGVDAAAAEALLKSSKCMTCHSVDKKKDGPAYAEVAKKYADDPEALQKVIDWISSEHTVEIDGEEDTHPMAKTKDASKIGNLAAWILSR